MQVCIVNKIKSVHLCSERRTPMSKESVIKLKRPAPEDFGATLQDSSGNYFGENIVLLQANNHMLRHILGSGTPHRMQDIRLCLHAAGHADCSVNLERQRLGPGAMQLFGSGTIFQQHEVSDDIHLMELLISSDAISELMFGSVPPLFQCKASNFVVHLSQEEQKCYMDMYSLLLRLLRSEGEESPAVRGLIYSLFYFALGIFLRYEEPVGGKHSRQNVVFHEFSQLLTQSDGRQRRLSYYAQKLNVSEHYLSMAVKQVSGSTPKELIDNVVVAEIKVMLRYTDLTVQQIAYHLDISSESFLCRFFRRMTGFTPLEYRNKTML